MGLLNNIKKGIKETVNEVSKEVEKRKEIRRQKLRILNQLEMKDLKKVCKNYGIGKPYAYDPAEYMLTGKKVKIKLTRNHYVNHIISSLTLEQIKIIAEKLRIRIPETKKVEPLIIKEPSEKIKKLKKATSKDEEELKKIIQVIKDFKPKKIFKKEAEYENTLYTRLEVFFPNIEYQVPYANSRIDIKIRGFGIEIKNHPDQNEINRLIGQLMSYRRFFKHTIVVIFNPKDFKAIKFLKEQIKELNLAATVIEK